jgi:hypothetical protein
MSGRTRKGNPYLRRDLCQAAWAGSHTRATYLAALYRRFKIRRGHNKATFAVAHQILIVAYQMLLKGEDYREQGGNYFDLQNKPKVVNRLVDRLTRLGYNAMLHPTPAAPTIGFKPSAIGADLETKPSASACTNQQHNGEDVLADAPSADLPAHINLLTALRVRLENQPPALKGRLFCIFRRIRNRLVHMQQQLPIRNPNRAICFRCDFPVLRIAAWLARMLNAISSRTHCIFYGGQSYAVDSGQSD